MTDDELAALIRRVDPDRFLGAIFAPAARRRDLFGLYAFNHELARAREVASTAPLALIRLHWWREVVEGAVRDHPVARVLRDLLDRGAFDPADLLALIDAREAEAETIADLASFMAYVRGTAGNLARIAGGALGVVDDGEREVLVRIGAGYAIARILGAAEALRRCGRDLLPQDGTDQTTLARMASDLLANRVTRRSMPVAALAVLARRDLARLRRGEPQIVRGIGDRLAVLTQVLIASATPSPPHLENDMTRS